MLRTIVEGEPGIFPDPVARIMRSIGGIFRRRPTAARPTTDEATHEATEDATDAAAPDAPRRDDGGGPDSGPGQSGASR